MDCKRIQEMLADYLGDELDAHGRADFESHLATCPQCRDEAQSLQTTLGRLKHLTGPPASMTDSSDLSLSGRKRHTPAPRRYALHLLAYAATLAIGVGIGWFAQTLLSHTDKASTPTLPTQEGLVVPGIPEGAMPNQFVRNAMAFSAAFNNLSVANRTSTESGPNP